MKVLICNVGSTSYKYKLFEMEDESMLAWGSVERMGSSDACIRQQATGKDEVTRAIKSLDHAVCVKETLSFLTDAQHSTLSDFGQVAAIGFKVVGARNITGGVILDEKVLKSMEEYNPLLLTHNPPYIKIIRIFKEMVPELPLVGLFETAFHRDMPVHAYIYPVPYEWYEKYGVRRYGYHGASLSYISERVPKILTRPATELRLVACHLGGSSSVCAIKFGKSIDTSMGMSNNAGIPMSNRSSDFDPFILPFIMDKEGLTTDQIRKVLTERGGLAGISGLSGDVRDLEVAAAQGNYRAQLALDVFSYEVRKYIGAYAAAMGGLNVIAFTGGIGENSIVMREQICRGLEFLGVSIDKKRNKVHNREAIISKNDSEVTVLVVPTNEEIIVAREVLKVLRNIQ